MANGAELNWTTFIVAVTLASGTVAFIIYLASRVPKETKSPLPTAPPKAAPPDRRPAELVPTDRNVLHPSKSCHFQIPWPWSQVPCSDLDWDIEIRAPRYSGPKPVGFVRVEPGNRDASEKISKHIHDGKEHQWFLVDGRWKCIELVTRRPDAVIHRVAISGQGKIALLQFTLPASSDDGFSAHIETMLATWRWH